MTEATAADYAWFNNHWLREAFSITLVHGLDEAEVLRRFGGEGSQPATSPRPGGRVVRVVPCRLPTVRPLPGVAAGGTAGAVAGTQAVSVFDNSIEGCCGRAARPAGQMPPTAEQPAQQGTPFPSGSERR